MSDDHLPEPSASDIAGYGRHHDDPQLTEELLSMNTGTLYGSEEWGAFLHDGDGNWFSFGRVFTEEAGQAMVDLMTDGGEDAASSGADSDADADGPEDFEIGLTDYAGMTKWVPIAEFGPVENDGANDYVHGPCSAINSKWYFNEIAGIRPIEEEDPEPDLPEFDGFQMAEVLVDTAHKTIYADESGEPWVVPDTSYGAVFVGPSTLAALKGARDDA